MVFRNVNIPWVVVNSAYFYFFRDKNKRDVKKDIAYACMWMVFIAFKRDYFGNDVYFNIYPARCEAS